MKSANFSALLAVAALCTALLAGFAFFWSPRAAGPSGTPKLECKHHYELGERVLGENVETQVELINSGTAPLIIDRIRLSCTCAGLEIIEWGQRFSARRLVIPPNSKQAALVRLQVRGRAGEDSVSSIVFASNDPEKPERTLVFHASKVFQGLTWQPYRLVHACLAGDPEAKDAVILFDDRPAPFEAVEATSSDPRVAARFVPVASAVDKSARVGSLELSLTPPAEPCVIEGTIALRVKNHVRTEHIPFQIVVHSAVECSPATPALAASGGRNEGQVRVRLLAKEVRELKLAAPVEGVNVVLEPTQDSQVFLATVKLTKAKLDRPFAAKAPLIAATADREYRGSFLVTGQP